MASITTTANNINFKEERFPGLAMKYFMENGSPLSIKSGPYQDVLDSDSIYTLNNRKQWMSVSDAVIEELKGHVRSTTGLNIKTMQPVVNEFHPGLPNALRSEATRFRDGRIRFVVLGTLDTGSSALIVFEREKYNAFIFKTNAQKAAEEAQKALQEAQKTGEEAAMKAEIGRAHV